MLRMKIFALYAPSRGGEGGEICLYEPGFVLESANGDWVIFPSQSLTHFNMHFQDIQMSIVFPMNSLGKVWVITYNDWTDFFN